MISYDATLDRAVIRPVGRVFGSPSLPSDKSIAHRAALFAAVGDGTSDIINFPRSADPRSTLACISQLGIEIEEAGDELRIHGRGLHGLSAPSAPLDAGNSGTTMRLLAGLLAGQTFDSTIQGDESLNRRPMERIAKPLRQMGASLHLTEGHAPIRIEGGHRLHGITYRLPIPSAQVKSCVLLAGLYAKGPTTVIEESVSRDHTERMLGLSTLDFGGERRIMLDEGTTISARAWTIPHDFSAAAFFIVAAALAQEGEVRMEQVGLNPTRCALLDVLQAMGAEIEISNEAEYSGEQVGDLIVKPSQLNAISVEGDIIPILIDEIPILAVAATAAEGRTEIRGASELRVKETDRIRAMVDNLSALGADVEEFEDGFAIQGPATLMGTAVSSYGDHRIAMAMAVAGLIAKGETTIDRASCSGVSFPGFWEELSKVVEPA